MPVGVAASSVPFGVGRASGTGVIRVWRLVATSFLSNASGEMHKTPFARRVGGIAEGATSVPFRCGYVGISENRAESERKLETIGTES
jgi:hypothetical protein